jgi:hypothetical protein
MALHLTIPQSLTLLRRYLAVVLAAVVIVVVILATKEMTPVLVSLIMVTLEMTL